MHIFNRMILQAVSIIRTLDKSELALFQTFFLEPNHTYKVNLNILEFLNKIVIFNKSELIFRSVILKKS